jgi:hypothetical protein
MREHRSLLIPRAGCGGEELLPPLGGSRRGRLDADGSLRTSGRPDRIDRERSHAHRGPSVGSW